MRTSQGFSMYTSGITAMSSLQDTLILEQQIARLQALLEASRQVHSTIQASEVLQQTARIVVRELEMEGAVFLASDGDVMASYGEAPQPPFDGCPRFALLSKEGSSLATLIVATPQNAALSLYEQDFLEGLVLQTAVALENATFHERNLQWARVQQDLDAARQIQRSLLPKAMPQIPGFAIAARSTTCYEVGGDYLDTIELPDGSHLMVVADVAGKGLASAIVATSFRSALRSLASRAVSLAEMASQVGQQHYDEGSEARRRYVTAILLRLDPRTGEGEIVNCGHNPGILLEPDRSLRMIEASGPPLGMFPGMTYTAEPIHVPAGARVLLYTDGLSEVFCGEDEFGCERLAAAFQQLETRDPEAMLDAIWATLAAFSNNAPPTDDMTGLALCHLEAATA
ncbi:PP2C family protein-serine/threonine phosphatase [Terriglobus albidus]|uniref:PP2C family protein-serine/threonine phosphatase n=1 Tax=Terriglobus albidus TaxID=1592106 RepID=UPI0021E02281|nr:SpoIIE family protein phosphatase [Terriglobus albidus]